MNWSFEFIIGDEENPLVHVRVNDQNILRWIVSAYVFLTVLIVLS